MACCNKSMQRLEKLPLRILPTYKSVLLRPRSWSSLLWIYSKDIVRDKSNMFSPSSISLEPVQILTSIFFVREATLLGTCRVAWEEGELTMN